MGSKPLAKWPCLLLLLAFLPFNAQAAICDARFLTEQTTLTIGSYTKSIAWSRDSRALAALDMIEWRLYVWDMPSGKLRFKREILPTPLHGLVFSGSGQEIYALDADKEAVRAFTIFDATNGARIRYILGPINSSDSALPPAGNSNAKLLLLNSDATLLAAIHTGRTFFSVYDTSNWEIIETVQYNKPTLITHSSGVELSGDAIWFIGASGFWQQMHRYSFPRGEFLFGKRFTKNNMGDPRAAALSPNEKLMAVALYAGFQEGMDKYHLELWNTENWQERFVIQSANIDQLSFHPKGDLIAGIGMHNRRNTIQIFSARQHTLLAAWVASGPSPAIAFSPDGSQLAYGDGRRLRICGIKP